MTAIGQAVVLCGGLGTRLRPLTDSMPKPMVPVDGKPFLEYLLAQLAEQGLKRFLLLTGYRGDMIREYFGNGGRWGWKIDYSQGVTEWETGKRLVEAQGQLDERFLLLYSDNFVQFNLSALEELHSRERALVTLHLAPKNKGNIRVSSAGRIEAYVKDRIGHALDYVEVGYMIVERDPVFALFPELVDYPDFNFSVALTDLAAKNRLAGLIVRDPYHSISDLGRLELVRSYLRPKKILLIDRDGVMNRKAPRGEYVSTWEDFEWIPETREAMVWLAREGFQFVIITNQAGIARGMIRPEDLEQIHRKMIYELESDGVRVLGLYICPHHWDEDCECRKPKPGMFFQISKDHALRMDRTIFLGDDVRDVQAAVRAGCGAVLIGSARDYDSIAVKPRWAMNAPDLLQAVPWIVQRFQEWEHDREALTAMEKVGS